MNLFYLTFGVALSFLAIRMDARSHNFVSLITLPFRYHHIAPDYVDPAPKRLLQVC